MVGAVMTLDGWRRSWIGGGSLGIFVSLESDAPVSVFPNLDHLEYLNNNALKLIESLPPHLSWAASPFLDYCTATTAFVECIRSKLEEIRPPQGPWQCVLYWENA